MQVKPRLERKGMQAHKKRRKDRRRRKKGDSRWEERTRRKSKGDDRRRRKLENRRMLSRKKSTVAGNGYEEQGASQQRVTGSKDLLARGTKSEGKTRVSRQAMKEAKKVRRGRKERLGSMEGTKTKVRNRCVDTGNGRSMIRWFRKSGRQVRERGRRGKLEGVFRVSW